ncbi:disease resistance RPP13-like protein 4 [Phaseolus vulgaris]|uniref:disease resistance RPP13-like protein 4 n=1 Tax=Phaseolus vulgaris TaxID=3885 RepID=UPI0035C9A5F0
MSIRTNKMKAISVLLKELMTARSKFQRKRDASFDGKLEKLRLDLNKIKDVFVRVKKNEEELIDTLAEVHAHLRKLDRKKLDEDMDFICKRIRDSAHKLLPMDAFDDSYKEEDHKGNQIFHSSQELQQPHQKIWSLEDYLRLDHLSKGCLFSLLIFPDNTVIRKSNAINLWIGEGLIVDKENKTTKEWGEDVIDNLLKCRVIVRYGNEKCPLIKKFRILPNIRRHLKSYTNEYVDRLEYNLEKSRFQKTRLNRLKLEQNRVILGDWHFDYSIHTIFNVGASYLNFRPQWVKQFPNLKVLQLGCWQDSPLHHIEVGSEEFLKELRNLTHLKYLSLRGISNIFELPSSIVELERLLVLDLKACHNLETLPNDISSMKSLTHLILSQCCLLEEMPKGIEKLTNLQVLKGFVISTPRKTPCRISDLVNLKKLRQLSIHIGSEAVIRDREFESLEGFLALKCLKISWSGSDPRYGNIFFILPPNLTKLHLECFPGKIFRECMFDTRLLEQQMELNITGGKLESMEADIQWEFVDILRLKYLKPKP